MRKMHFQTFFSPEYVLETIEFWMHWWGEISLAEKGFKMQPQTDLFWHVTK